MDGGLDLKLTRHVWNSSKTIFERIEYGTDYQNLASGFLDCLRGMSHRNGNHLLIQLFWLDVGHDDSLPWNHHQRNHVNGFILHDPLDHDGNWN